MYKIKSILCLLLIFKDLLGFAGLYYLLYYTYALLDYNYYANPNYYMYKTTHTSLPSLLPESLSLSTTRRFLFLSSLSFVFTEDFLFFFAPTYKLTF